MKKFAPLFVLVLIASALIVYLWRGGGPGDGGEGEDGGLTTPVATAPGPGGSGEAATTTGPETPELPVQPETAGTAEAPSVPAPPPEWVAAEEYAGELGAIAGKVTLAPGVPALGAAAALSGPASRQGFSNSTGQLVLGKLPPGSYRLAVGFAGYPTIVKQGVTVAKGRVTNLGTLDFGGAAGAPGPVPEVQVTVTSKEGKKKLAGATVILTTIRPYGLYFAIGTEGRPGELSLTTTTDVDGVALIRGLRPGAYDVLVQAKDHALGAHENLRVTRITRARIPIELPKAVAISGQVVHADGTPAEGTFVAGMKFGATLKSYPSVTTGAEGKFTFGGLDTGQFFLLAFKDGHGSAQRMGVPAPSKDVKLQLGTAHTVVGRVLNKADGTPVVQYAIRPFQGGQPFAYTYSMAFPINDAEGRFELPLDPGTYNLEIVAPGFAHTTVTGILAAAPGADGAVTAKPVDIYLEPAASVHGTVRAKGLGTPIVGAEIFLKVGGMPGGPHKEIYAVSGPEGLWRIDGLSSEQLNLHVTHPEYSSTQVEGVQPVPGEGTAVAVELGGGGAVAGLVRDAQDQPAPNVTVSLFTGGDIMNARTATTGPGGRFRFEPVTPGKYSLATGNLGAQQGGNFKTVTVTEGAVAEVELGGGRAPGQSVTGRVTRNGAAVAGATVNLWIDGRNAEGQGEGSYSATTGEDGGFVIENVVPGRYNAFVEISGAVARRDVEVSGDGPPPTVQLELREAAIRGTVRAPEGDPLEGAWVTLEKVAAGGGGPLKGYHGQSYTKADGAFAMTGLPDGTYRLRVFHLMGKYASSLVDDLQVSGGVGIDGLQVKLTAPRQVSGRVTTVGGAPVGDARLRMLDSQGRDFAMIGFHSTSSDGRYTYPGLRADVYTLVIEAAGYAPASATVDLSNVVSRVVDLQLTPGATLKISVADTNGVAVVGAAVELRDLAGALVTKGVSIFNILEGTPATDTNGVAWWKDLAAGPYKVRVIPIGGAPVETQATATAGQITAIQVEIPGG